MKTKYFLSLLAAFFISTGLFAATSFSGYAGGKLNYAANPEKTTFDPELKLQAFFAGQFNFSQNLWSHLEFSINTGNLLSESIFHATDSKFQIDELSLIFRGNMYTSANYFSAFMGTYDPIGSDIFLQRYFNIKPIDSKITESYLGIAGSILYPHFGFGVSDVIRFYNQPIAFGGYIYINHEDRDYYVVNADLRFAANLSYFTCDFACGLGIPLADKYKGEDVIIAVEKLYWHAGTTMLIGNNYTQSLFIQAGLFNVPFTKRNGTQVSPQDLYLLVEPRLLLDIAHVNLTVFSLPQETVDQLMFVDDSLGVNLNIYGDTFSAGANRFTLGTNFSYSITGKTFMDLAKPLELIKSDFNVTMTPYMSTNFLSGELHTQFSIKFMKFSTKKWYDAFTVAIGYPAQF